jgi:hypothetical protein
MKPNYYHIFKLKLKEEEVVTPIENESNLEKILEKPNKISKVLALLLTTQNSLNNEAKTQLREVVSDIKCISYKPTTFRVVIPNGNYFDLKYDPTPLNIQYPDDFQSKDSFTVIVSGKKFHLANNSELDSAIDYINILLSTSPIGKEPEPGAEPAAEPETPPEGETPPEEEA